MISRRVFTFLGLPMLLAISAPALARDITHVMGVTSVPEAPVRIVALTNEATEDLLALGIVPVGAVRSANAAPWFDHVAEALAQTTLVGEELAPNLEVILSLQPDLILGNKKRHEAIYEQLSAIAPSVYVENVTGQWRDNLAFYAEAVGKSAEGQAALNAYVQRVDAIKAALGDRVNEKVGLVRFIAGQNYAYNNDSFSGSILRDIGFGRPAAQDKAGLAEPITLERIPELDGDRLLHFSYETGDGGAKQEAETWMASPLWQGLAAVKAGHVHAVSDTVWATAGGIMAAHLALDDIERIYALASTR
ncbi:iron-siderophore ABC transporter substrate-binding protein [Devosia sp. XJ19-1]|uniref:Iron-siderophore ABC transporter substrate-binding protein n=1 Tax=Devosia ureilytica TaxID=2952754 RepID=A0A9Q4ANQ2_9HYPH|nr:iron-siderophore ABC transporter substrate-binding protein [Devosia ureilytica]MCP8882696.1 iron-siderophore ABC transporter substrate-binding protein [Devosia ureilytica]MCP8886936.1 iron-siderophore ABC transporter substrate-binding protein [Devosia ureilytica]